MKKIYLLTILMFFLLSSTLIKPLTANSASVNQQLIMLDFPGLQLFHISKEYPNLLKLFSTGSATLVTVPNPAMTAGPISFSLRIVRDVLGKNSLNACVINKKGIHSGSDQVAVIKLDDMIPFRAMTSGSPQDSLIPLAKNITTDSIANHFRLEQYPNRIVVFSWVDHYQYSPKFLDSDFNHQLLQYYDDLTGLILDKIDFNHTLLLGCAYCRQPNPDSKYKNLVAVVYKDRNFADGIIYAPNTRIQGIITCADLRETISNSLKSRRNANHHLKKIPGQWRNLAVIQPELIRNYAVRWPILAVLGFLVLGILFSLIFSFIFHFPKSIITMLVWMYIFLLTIPGAFIVEALINPTTWPSIVFYTLIISEGIFLLSHHLAGKKMAHTFKWISFFTVGLLMIDALLNGRIESKSFLGFSVLAGGRYYGIGNEYMGILMGAYIAGTTLSLPEIGKWRREILWGMTLFLSFILFYPYFGSDVGGGITALMGLGITNYLWLKQPIHFKNLAGLCLLTLFILMFMALLDFYVYGSAMSHLGKLLLAVQQNGIRAFIDLVIRKINMNLRLISDTPLTIILIGVLILIPLLYWKPPILMKRFIEKYPEIIAGFVGLAITAFIGLITNDSGIISAAMAFLLGIGLILPLILQERFI